MAGVKDNILCVFPGVFRVLLGFMQELSEFPSKKISKFSYLRKLFAFSGNATPHMSAEKRLKYYPPRK